LACETDGLLGVVALLLADVVTLKLLSLILKQQKRRLPESKQNENRQTEQRESPADAELASAELYKME
jgi:hypothetical protein